MEELKPTCSEGFSVIQDLERIFEIGGLVALRGISKNYFILRVHLTPAAWTLWGMCWEKGDYGCSREGVFEITFCSWDGNNGRK